MVEKSLVSRQEAKSRELESRLEFEKTQVKRLEVSVQHRWRSPNTGPVGSRETRVTPRGKEACGLTGPRSKVRIGGEKVILPCCTSAFLPF